VDEKELKVTDKRIFTADGELREEYRHLETASPHADAPPDAPGAARAVNPPAPSEPSRAAEATSGGPETQHPSRPLEIPDAGPGLGGPTFFDLVAMLAEPASLYLGDLTLADGKAAEDLEMARLHIDLLALLRQKTQSQLNPQETAFLDELLYRLRVRYVQKRG
jgi:hypothetical protein